MATEREQGKRTHDMKRSPGWTHPPSISDVDVYTNMFLDVGAA
jgi:hypothetical protein